MEENMKKSSSLHPAEYIWETRVRYSECGLSGQAGLSGILNYLQDACTFQAEDLGVGVRYMRQRQAAWVLNSWQADIVRYPVLGEKIAAATWPYGFHSFYGYRNFTLSDGDGNCIVRANSVWVYMDVQKGRPVKIPPETEAAFTLGEKLEMEYMERKIPDFQEGEGKEAVCIPRHFIDTNNHVNNAKYILLAEELLPPDFKAMRIRAEYRRPAVYGDMLYPYVKRCPGYIAARLSSADGKPYAAMEFYTAGNVRTEK